MGQWDVPILVGGAVVAGYFIITNPDFISGLFPPTEPPIDEEPPIEDGNGNGGGDGNGNGNGGSTDCKKACSNCWCKSYNENCSGSCSKCKGGSRCIEKCGEGVRCSSGGSSGGGSSSSSGSFGGTSSGSSKAEICGDLCRRKECSTYQKTCSGSCKNCVGSSGCKSMCSTAQCGSYKKAGCSKSACPGCAFAFATYRYHNAYATYPHDSSSMRLTIA